MYVCYQNSHVRVQFGAVLGVQDDLWQGIWLIDIIQLNTYNYSSSIVFMQVWGSPDTSFLVKPQVSILQEWVCMHHFPLAFKLEILVLLSTFFKIMT